MAPCLTAWPNFAFLGYSLDTPGCSSWVEGPGAVRWDEAGVTAHGPGPWTPAARMLPAPNMKTVLLPVTLLTRWF